MEETPHEKRRRLVRQRWINCALFALTLLGLLAVWAMDEPPPDATALQPTLRQLPDDQNAWLVLKQAAELVKWDYEVDLKALDDWESLKAMMQGKEWDAAKATAWLAGRETVWPLMERAASLGAGQAPLSDPAELVPYMGPLRDGEKNFMAIYTPEWEEFDQLFRLSLIRAWALFYGGQPDAGLDLMLTSLRAVRLLEESRGGASSYYNGASIRRAIEARFAAMGAQQEVSPAALRRALTVLAQTRPNTAEFGQNLRESYRNAAFAIEALAQGKEATVFDKKPLPNFLSNGINWPLLFKPHQSERLLAEVYSDALTLIEADWAKIQVGGRLEQEHLLGGHDWRVFNPSNLFGRSIMSYLDISPYNFLRQRAEERSTDSATEAFIALRLYFAEHGTLPTTLGQLVPDYLPAVPLDYFDRAPIRYSPANRAVWSVNTHHFDVTSPDLDPDVTRHEIYFKLGFAAPPAPVPAVPATNP